MAEKEYICAYRNCLHHGEKITESESVVINNKRYHWDCAIVKREIKECADTYIDYFEDKSKYPMVIRIINVLVFKNKIPIDYILEKIKTSKNYYEKRPPQALYGIRRLYWEKKGI